MSEGEREFETKNGNTFCKSRLFSAVMELNQKKYVAAYNFFVQKKKMGFCIPFRSDIKSIIPSKCKKASRKVNHYT